MTLQQHLGNTCGAAEVSVNLEGRMRVEHVGIGAAMLFCSAENQERVGSQRQLVLNQFVGVIAIEEAGP